MENQKLSPASGGDIEIDSSPDTMGKALLVAVGLLLLSLITLFMVIFIISVF
jgi:hypothetical protein